MDWLNAAWLATYWLPLAIALVLGIILGWLFTRPSIGRTREEYESHIYNLDTQARRRDEELTAANRESSRMQQNWEETSTELDAERTRLASFQHDVETAQGQNRELANSVEERDNEIAKRLAELQKTTKQLSETKAALEAATAENITFKADLQALRATVANRAELSQSTQQALGEAYSQLSGLRDQLDEAGSALTTAQSNVDSLHKALVD